MKGKRPQTWAAAGVAMVRKQRFSPSPSYPALPAKSTAPRLLFANTARGWKPVGRVEQRGALLVLTKSIDSRKHRLYRPSGYALEQSVITEAESLRVAQVEITERDTGRILTAPLSAFRIHGLRLRRGGFARQICLPLARWQVVPSTQQSLFSGGPL